jgi:Ser/Thr protein kinase RdoA (MazF antagonist)
MTRAVPLMALPTPGRTAAAARARLGRPPLAPEVVDAVLDGFGLRRTGAVRRLACGWRNDNVLVSTTGGRKVLRRHRAGWLRSTVDHEHAVLGELERVGFAAPRLGRKPDGGTVVDLQGRSHAVFTYEAGTNLAGLVLSRARRASALEEAGATLARLHRVLEPFKPPHAHHLAEPGPGERHQAAALAEATTAHRPETPQGIAALRSLVARAEAVDARLAMLDRQLLAVDLTLTVIHGDYGLHNLLFRRDGTVVVLDLELARRAPRLVDIVTTLARYGPSGERSLLAGYQREGGLSAAETAALPAFWEQHWLRAGLRSWRNHHQQGGERRLLAALARLERAASAHRLGDLVA